jgi:hypothetical protein
LLSVDVPNGCSCPLSEPPRRCQFPSRDGPGAVQGGRPRVGKGRGRTHLTMSISNNDPLVAESSGGERRKATGMMMAIRRSGFYIVNEHPARGIGQVGERRVDSVDRAPQLSKYHATIGAALRLQRDEFVRRLRLASMLGGRPGIRIHRAATGSALLFSFRGNCVAASVIESTAASRSLTRGASRYAGNSSSFCCVTPACRLCRQCRSRQKGIR